MLQGFVVFMIYGWKWILTRYVPEEFLMKPIKSVSGIIGIGHNIKYNAYTCQICDSNNCLYKNLKRHD